MARQSPKICVIDTAEPETKAERSKRLSDEAAAIANEVVTDLVSALEGIAKDAGEVSGLDTVKAGIRDRARQLAVTLVDEAKAIQALFGRGGI